MPDEKKKPKKEPEIVIKASDPISIPIVAAMANIATNYAQPQERIDEINAKYGEIQIWQTENPPEPG